MFFWAFVGLLALACLLAALRGGRPERLAAASFLLAWAASVAVARPIATRFATLETATMAIDLLLFLTLLGIALRSTRYWPMALVSLQAILLIAHLVKAYDPLLIRAVYQRMTLIWPFLQLLILIAGTAAHTRAQKTAIA